MRRLALLLVALVSLFDATVAHANGLTLATPSGPNTQGQCYASGNSGPRVPCVLQGQTWTRVLRPTDDASSMTAAPAGGVPRTNQDWRGDTANVLDFRKDGDPDYSAAFTRAIATGKQVRAPKLGGGYDINSCVTIPTGVHVLFEGTSTVRSTSATCIFRMTGYDVSSSLEGGAIFDMAGAPTGSTAVRLGTSSGIVYRVTLSDFRCQNTFECIGDETSTSNYVVDLTTRNIVAELTRGRQFYIRRSRGFFTVDLRVDHTRNTGQVTWESIRIADMAGLDIVRMDVLGPSVDTVPTITYQPDAVAIVLSNPAPGAIASIYLNGRILVDDVRGPGVILGNISNFIGGQIQVYGSLGQGFVCQACNDINTAISVVGRAGTPAAPGAPSVQFDNSARIRGTVAVRSSPSTGVYLNNCIDCILDVSSIDNVGYGLVEGGARNRVSGTMRGASGSLIMSGTGSVATNYFANDNAFHPGPTTGTVP
jgi:hypothetical protein